MGVAAKPGVMIRGGIRLADGTPAAGNQIEIWEYPHDDDSWDVTHLTLGPGGRFTHQLAGHSDVSLAYFSQVDGRATTVRNHTPDCHWVTGMTIDDRSVNTGSIRLPEAFFLNVRIQDQNGVPIEHAGINVASCRGEDGYHCVGTGAVPTNEDGLFVNRHTDVPGIEMSGRTLIQVFHPDGYPNVPYNDVTESRIIEVESPTTEVFTIKR